MSKPSASSGGRGRGNSDGQLLLVGFVLFFVSWFVPVYAGQDVLGTLRGLVTGMGAAPAAFNKVDAPDWLPGWGACKVAWSLLVDADSKLSGDDQWQQRLAGSSCLTNIVMVLAIVLLLARHRVLVGLALLGCTAVNASWIYLLDQNPFEVYRAGYFLWLLSFALAGIGALIGARRA